jgi:hypothetical protein
MADDMVSLCSKHGWYQDQWECPLCEKGLPCRDLSKLRPQDSDGSSVSHRGKDIEGVMRGPDGRYLSSEEVGSWWWQG